MNIEYDKQGRMKYHPSFHTRHKIPLTEEEKEYLCKFYEIDGRRTIAMALGKTETNISQIVHIFRKNGLYEYYKNLHKFY